MTEQDSDGTALKVYQVTVEGTPVFELVAETAEKARNLLASRLRNLNNHVEAPPSPGECSIEQIGQVTADATH